MRLSFWEERGGEGGSWVGGQNKVGLAAQRKVSELQKTQTTDFRIVLIRHKYVEHLLYKRRSYPCDVTDTAEMVDDFKILNST